jgi:hypothetical protein
MNWLYAKNLSTMINRLIVAYDINQYLSDLGHIPYSVVIWICNAYMTTFCTRTKTMWPVFCAARSKVGLSQIGIYKKKWLTGNMEVPINVQTHPQSMVGKAGKKTKYLHLDIMVGTVDACEILHHQPDSYFNPVFFWEQPTPSINWCNFFFHSLSRCIDSLWPICGSTQLVPIWVWHDVGAIRWKIGRLWHVVDALLPRYNRHINGYLMLIPCDSLQFVWRLGFRLVLTAIWILRKCWSTQTVPSDDPEVMGSVLCSHPKSHSEPRCHDINIKKWTG